MSLQRLNSKATVGINDAIKIIIYIAILVSAGFAVKAIVSRVIG